MKYSLLMQVVLIGAACVIIFTYVMPKFDETKTIQDDIFKYSDAVDKASQYNARLQELLATKESFPQEGLASLEKFIPLSIDEIAIMHDLESILVGAKIQPTSMTVAEEIAPFSEASVEEEIVYNADGTVMETVKPTIVLGIYSRDFKVMFSSSYEDMKNALAQIEANPALLEVVEFTLKPAIVSGKIDVSSPLQGGKRGEYSFELTLRAFGLTPSS